jgi:hypothetical protein
MKILVRAKNAEIAPGTERLLTMIEQAMKEDPKPNNLVAYYKILSIDDAGTTVLLESENRDDLTKALNAGDGVVFTYMDPDKQHAPDAAPDYKATKTAVANDDQNANAVKVTVNAAPSDELKKKVASACVGRFLSKPIPPA